MIASKCIPVEENYIITIAVGIILIYECITDRTIIIYGHECYAHWNWYGIIFTSVMWIRLNNIWTWMRCGDAVKYHISMTCLWLFWRICICCGLLSFPSKQSWVCGKSSLYLALCWRDRCNDVQLFEFVFRYNNFTYEFTYDSLTVVPVYHWFRRIPEQRKRNKTYCLVQL